MQIDLHNLRLAYKDSKASLQYEIETLWDHYGDRTYRGTVAVLAASGDAAYQKDALAIVAGMQGHPNNSYMSTTLLQLFLPEVADFPNVGKSIGIPIAKVETDAQSVIEEGYDGFEIAMIYHLILLTLKRSLD